MLTRAIIIGTLLAAFTGGVVYFGLGEAGGEIPVKIPAKTPVKTDISPKVELDDKTAPPAKVAESVIVTPPAATAFKEVEKLSAAEDAEITQTITDELGGMIDSKIEGQAAQPSAQDTVKAMMKPKATGTFIVKDDVSSAAPVQVAKEDIAAVMAQEKSAEASAKSSAKKLAALKDNLKSARMITNKTTRDKIYFEVFENAIADGHIDMARNLGEKLSTPELRSLAREAVSNAETAVQ